MNIELEKTCYILPQLSNGPIHPITHRRHDLIWYPERSMNLIEQIMYKPFVQSVVTECPWIIACYDCDNVRVWENKEWQYPNKQTYGADIAGMYDLMDIRQSIPSTPLDGGKRMQKYIEKLIEERS